MSLPAYVVAARTLAYLSQRQEVVANNLANVSTEGFKADRVTGRSFGELFPEAFARIDLQQGMIRETGQRFDLALEGEGFLIVQTPVGERLTRGGQLSVDDAGFLTDRDGNLVLGLEGPLLVRDRVLEIDADGTVLADDARVDRLRMEMPTDLARLVKEGFGRYRNDGAQHAAEQVRVRQGALEEGNVDALTGTVDMLQIQRVHSANTEVLRVIDSIMATLSTDIGRV